MWKSKIKKDWGAVLEQRKLKTHGNESNPQLDPGPIKDIIETIHWIWM